MQDFKNLKVWQKAHELALLTYRITADFPRDEVFGLRHSMRKFATDVPAFVAESCRKANDAEASRTITAAVATSNRLEYYALMARDLEFFSPQTHEDYERRLIEVKKMLNGFNKRLN